MPDTKTDHDAIVVGAGFGGMYMVHLLREAGLRVQGIERGEDVGGTWYWNRYPGCRCDVESMEYSYRFSDKLQQDWDWTERYASQPEILSYASHVADAFDLRRSFSFGETVTGAAYDDDAKLWRVTTDKGTTRTSRFLIMATGCLSSTNIPAFDGLEGFEGQTFHTGAWPHEGVDFTGKRVAVIGTGSSGIQSIPIIAEQAAQLTVFQRTPNFSVPAQNRPMDPAYMSAVKADYAGIRARNREQQAGFGSMNPRHEQSVFDVSEEERNARFEEFWAHGGFIFMGAFGDLGLDPKANEIAADFVRSKIRDKVNDPATAELLCPDTVLGCKRLVADTGYFETFNRENVRLVDVNAHPIQRLTPEGLIAGDESFSFDAIVFATGFDAMTGSLLRCNITGEDGLPLTEKWSAGPRTYLGLMTVGFPNLFMMTGPGSPSVLSNMISSVETHAEFICQFVKWTTANRHQEIKPELAAEDQWVEEVNMRSEATLYPQCNSWYLGANVPGKPRVFMPYIGFPDYDAKLKDVVAKGYDGFAVA